MKKWFKRFAELDLIKKIILRLILGIVLGQTLADVAAPISIFGTLFVRALKAVAPILVFFFLVIWKLSFPRHHRSRRGFRAGRDSSKTMKVLRFQPDDVSEFSWDALAASTQEWGSPKLMRFAKAAPNGFSNDWE